ncbi:serine hydrolase [Gordonia sp. (in: high G+C Gram-positive bacteria)]|uniref:serine hydrolase domain-containing protein n=1 Tax=Gordonia sp. (in: high G+C Gram-positive bacteria) TaxID=84139 RepID=UPI0016AD9E79|nr:serine hydrolase domain-containing protein [Gordonia sp. (in: high G+C Gram-positive bacteria)]NLG45090.1 beta-lactamase family protein [Gordonia sp. (in: high G+C Gram-positive bacteria)]
MPDFAPLDDILQRVVSADPDQRVPGVVATVTRSDGDVYVGAAGARSLDDPTPMTADTVFAVFSCTKALTSTTVLQCVEDGLLDLDAPASEYVPELGELPVLDGFAADGSQILRAPTTPITTRMLLLHTAGLSYSFFSEEYARLLAETGQPDILTASRDCLRSPLLFDPGTRWSYGTNMDWAGLVVESIRGQRLSEVMQKRVFDPLGMSESGFVMTDSMAARRAEVHQRLDDGSLVPTGLVLDQEPEVDMGGHGVYATIGDYTKYLRMWLRDGEGEHGRVLRAETVRSASVNGLGDLKVGMLASSAPALTHDAEFFPGQSKSWAYSFMVNDDEAPTGRTAGSLAWAGLANLYYWIDREKDVAGMWGTQILPFADPASVGGYLDFETAVYRAIS